mgnify:CR=1 FL=1
MSTGGSKEIRLEPTVPESIGSSKVTAGTASRATEASASMRVSPAGVMMYALLSPLPLTIPPSSSVLLSPPEVMPAVPTAVISPSVWKLYKPVLEDWIWYCILPLVSYVVLLVSAGFLASVPEPGLFGVATASVLLLFIGIHNAWDTATYIAITIRQQKPETDASPPAP